MLIYCPPVDAQQQRRTPTCLRYMYGCTDWLTKVELVPVLGLAKAASACKIKSSMAFEPDSLGRFESGKMHTIFMGN